VRKGGGYACMMYRFLDTHDVISEIDLELGVPSQLYLLES